MNLIIKKFPDLFLHKHTNAHNPYLVRVFKGDMKVELPENKELTLHHTVPQVPELLVAL